MGPDSLALLLTRPTDDKSRQQAYYLSALRPKFVDYSIRLWQTKMVALLGRKFERKLEVRVICPLWSTELNSDQKNVLLIVRHIFLCLV
jgi:hypothetical protein